jgi:hypothetical protein
MKKHTTLLAGAVLLLSSGVTLAQSQVPMRQQAPVTTGQAGNQADPRGTGITGAQSSTNPQFGGGAAGYLTPREVPENGGAAHTEVPVRRR